jgi:hypothetical protein
MALRCQGVVLMLADTSGIDCQPSPQTKKGLMASFFSSKKVETKTLWITRKLVLTDESLRFFRPREMKFDINDPTPYNLQNASDKLLTRVSSPLSCLKCLYLNRSDYRTLQMWSFAMLIKYGGIQPLSNLNCSFSNWILLHHVCSAIGFD